MANEFDLDAEMESLFSVKKSISQEEYNKNMDELMQDPAAKAAFSAPSSDADLEGMAAQADKAKQSKVQSEAGSQPLEPTTKGLTPGGSPMYIDDIDSMDMDAVYDLLDAYDVGGAESLKEKLGINYTPNEAFINKLRTRIAGDDPTYGLEKLTEEKQLAATDGIYGPGKYAVKLASIQANIDKVLHDPSCKGEVIASIKKSADEVDTQQMIPENIGMDGYEQQTVPKTASSQSDYDLDAEYDSLMRSYHKGL